MMERRFALRGPLDLVRTLSPLAHGRGDRTVRLGPSEAWVARRLDSGAATIQIRLEAGATAVTARAWGDGAEEALATAPALIGELDEPERLVAHHPVVRRLQRTYPGLRLPRSGRVIHALVPSILEQKITGTEAFRAYAAFLRAHGEPAPGPGDLALPPSAATLSSLPSYAFHPLGVERRRAEVIRRIASRAAWLEAARDAAEATARLMSFRGIGPWTAAEVVRAAYGDPDAVSVGDYHIPNTVAWVLAGEPRGDDARMLELLEPWRGHRGRVIKLLEAGAEAPPRYGPRMPLQDIAAL